MIHVQITRVLEKELASQGMSTYLTIHVLFVFDSILVSHNSLHPNTTSNCSYIYIYINAIQSRQYTFPFISLTAI